MLVDVGRGSTERRADRHGSVNYLTSNLSDDAVEVCVGVGKDAVGGDITGERVSEEVSVASEFRPRVDAARDAAFEPVRLGEIAAGDPEAFDREAEE